MTLPESWIAHRREDRELVDWIEPESDGFVPYDLLGRPRTPRPVDWLAAEELLDELGIGYLADIYALRTDDGSWIRARIVEVSPAGIGVKEDDFGDIGAAVASFRVPFPIDDRLVPLTEAPGPVRSRFL